MCQFRRAASSTPAREAPDWLKYFILREITQNVHQTLSVLVNVTLQQALHIAGWRWGRNRQCLEALVISVQFIRENVFESCCPRIADVECWADLCEDCSQGSSD